MKLYNPLLITYPCWIQPKLNGINCTLGIDGMLRSRTEQYFPAVQFDWPHPRYPLLGELYVHGWSLQDIVSGVTPDKPNEKSAAIGLHIFDAVMPGVDFVDRSRWIAAESFRWAGTRLTAVPTHEVRSNKECADKYYYWLCAGYEGMVYITAEGTFKRKPYLDEEYICVGVTEGKGKRAGHVGKFILRLPDGGTFNCGGGQVNYETLRYLYLNPPVEKKITVRYHSKSDSGVPLCAQFISVRTGYE
jgi:hypothetical protein